MNQATPVIPVMATSRRPKFEFDQTAADGASELRMVRPDGVGVCVAECSRASLIHWIDYPELPLRAHVRETLKCGRSALVVRADVPIGDRVVRVAYKRYSRRNLWKVVSGAFKPSRAFRAWRMGQLLRQQGIATPRPLIAVTPRSLSRRVDSYLATEFVDGFPLHALVDRIASLPATSQGSSKNPGMCAVSTVAERVGGLLGRLHAAGLRHRDLKAGNVLIAGDVRAPNSLTPVLIDLDGVSRHWPFSRAVRLRDLSRLCVCFGPELRQRPTAGLRFVRAYLAACGDPHWSWRTCWRQLVTATTKRGRDRARKSRRAA